MTKLGFVLGHYGSIGHDFSSLSSPVLCVTQSEYTTYVLWIRAASVMASLCKIPGMGRGAGEGRHWVIIKSSFNYLDLANYSIIYAFHNPINKFEYGPCAKQK